MSLSEWLALISGFMTVIPALYAVSLPIRMFYHERCAKRLEAAQPAPDASVQNQVQAQIRFHAETALGYKSVRNLLKPWLIMMLTAGLLLRLGLLLTQLWTEGLSL